MPEGDPPGRAAVVLLHFHCKEGAIFLGFVRRVQTLLFLIYKGGSVHG